MAEYITRSDAIKAVNGQNAFTMTRGALIDVLNGIPAADVASLVHGRWIMHDDELGLTCECSSCHIETIGDGNYCPNCGAKMDGGTDDAADGNV